MHSAPKTTAVTDAVLNEGFDNTISVELSAPVAGKAVIAAAFNPSATLSNSFTVTLKKESSELRSDTSILSQTHFTVEPVAAGNTIFSLQVTRNEGSGVLSQTASYYLLAVFIPA